MNAHNQVVEEEERRQDDEQTQEMNVRGWGLLWKWLGIVKKQKSMQSRL